MRRLPSELLGKADQNSFGTPDVAKPIFVVILNQFTDEFRASHTETRERVVDVLHGEHDTEVTECVHWCTAVIGEYWRRQKSRQLEPVVTIRRMQHGNLDESG